MHPRRRRLVVKSVELYKDTAIPRCGINDNKTEAWIIIEEPEAEGAPDLPCGHRLQLSDRGLQAIGKVLYWVVEGVVKLSSSELDGCLVGRVHDDDADNS